MIATNKTYPIDKMPKTTFGIIFSHIILYFLVYSILGWGWEKIYCSIEEGHLVSRGFLYGPYCPIYGFAILTILYLIQPYITKSKLFIFLIAALITTVFEFFTSLALEKIFHLKLWDYSDYFLNINGRVSVIVSAFWGFCCVVIVKYINPKIRQFVDCLYAHFGYILPSLIIILLLTDTFFSILKYLG